VSDRATYRFLAGLRGSTAAFGRILEAVRAAEGLTQAELGEKLGLSRARVCDFEKGRRLVTPRVAAAIATTFGYDPARFVAFALEDALAQEGFDYAVVVAQRRRQ
jgi:transcriptional regulator with XRE-family HTH domain